MSHTPGPWKWFPLPHNAPGRRLRGPSDYVTEIGGDGISDADAKLIAAAPDLVEALQNILKQYPEIVFRNGKPIQQAFAALAKAGVQS